MGESLKHCNSSTIPKKSAKKQAVKMAAFGKYGSQVIKQELDQLHL